MTLIPTVVTPTQAAAVSGVATSTTSFSPSAGSLVVVSFTYMLGTNTTGLTFTVADNHSNTYTLSFTPLNNGGAGATYVGMATFTYSGAPGSTTVHVTASGTGTADCLITPIWFTGQASSQTGAALASANSSSVGTTCEQLITPTTTGSFVVIAGAVSAVTVNSTAIAGTTLGASWNDSGVGNSANSGVTTSASTGGTQINVGFTLSGSSTFGYSIAALEVLPGTTTVTSTGAITLALAAAGAGKVGVISTAAVTLALAASGSATVANPITATAAVGFNLAVAGSAYQPITSTGAVSLNLATAGSVGETVTSTGAVSLNLQTAGSVFEAISSTGAVKLNLAASSLVTTTVGALAGSGRFAASYAAHPGTSQVAVAPPGTSTWQYMGSLGQVTALDYSFQCPGGCFAAAWTLMVPSTYRNQMFNPGNQVRIIRGGHIVWRGKLDEPVSSSNGWNFTATGDGVRGSDFVSYYTGTWPTGQPDASVNNAITRGLPWVNPGIGTPSGMWLGQQVDPATQVITDLLNLVCTRGGLTWYVNSQPGGMIGSSLSVFPLPTVANRLLICTEPIPRTLGGYINTLFIKYEVSADTTSGGSGSAAAAVFATTTVQNTQSANIHGVIENYIDLSNAGVLSQAQAQAVGNFVLQIYQAATFAGPFTANYGQLLTLGGQPIDPGTEQAGNVIQVIATDYGYGGEVTPQFPIIFPVGGYHWDDFAQVATIAPFQNLDQSLSGLLSMENTILTPITTPGG